MSPVVIDRVFFGEYLFTWSAYYPIIVIGFVSYFNVKRINKIADKAIEKY